MAYIETTSTKDFKTENKNIVMIKKINLDVIGLSKTIQDNLNKKDKIFFFNKGSQADFLGFNPVINPDLFNVFGIYDSKIYNLYNSIIATVKEFCKELDINYAKNEYYISTEYFNDIVDKKYLYDFGGISKPSFTGVMSLENSQFFININNNTEIINFGDMLFFEAGKTVSFSTQKIEVLYFYISPRFMIENQYPSKWFPLGV